MPRQLVLMLGLSGQHLQFLWKRFVGLRSACGPCIRYSSWWDEANAYCYVLRGRVRAPMVAVEDLWVVVVEWGDGSRS